MEIVCLDLEGVLVPEIWIAFAEEAGIPELRKTTREEVDYDKLMQWRLQVMKEKGLKLPQDRTLPRGGRLPGCTQKQDAGHYSERYLYGVCPRPDGKVEMADDLLQPAAGGKRR